MVKASRKDFGDANQDRIGFGAAGSTCALQSRLSATRACPPLLNSASSKAVTNKAALQTEPPPFSLYIILGWKPSWQPPFKGSQQSSLTLHWISLNHKYIERTLKCFSMLVRRMPPVPPKLKRCHDFQTLGVSQAQTTTSDDTGGAIGYGEASMLEQHSWSGLSLPQQNLKSCKFECLTPTGAADSCSWSSTAQKMARGFQSMQRAQGLNCWLKTTSSKVCVCN